MSPSATAPLRATRFDAIVWEAEVRRVVDADTLDLLVDSPLFAVGIRVRLAGVQAPEMHAADPAIRERAKAARAWVAGEVPPGTAVLVHSAKPDKYGRRLARVVYLRAGAQADLSAELLAAGHARPYDGVGRAGDA